jgi:hypothetical protein
MICTDRLRPELGERVERHDFRAGDPRFRAGSWHHAIGNFNYH